MSKVNSSVSIPFRAPDDPSTDDSGPIYRIEPSNREPPREDQRYFRVHGDIERIVPNSGSVTRSNRGLVKYVVEQQAFNGSSFVKLNYPKAQNVKIELIGSLLHKDRALTTAIKCTYDPVREGVRASHVCYGVIKITYNAPYDLWLATFGGRCPSKPVWEPPADISKGSVDDDTDTQGRDLMLLLGFVDDEIVASTTLDPPPCQPEDEQQKTTMANRNLGTQLPQLKIEIDPRYPPKLRKRADSLSLTANCRVRVFPSTGTATLVSTSGYFAPMLGTDKMVVKDSVIFSGSASANLKYMPTSTPDVVLVGDFIDIFGRVFTPGIRLPGQTIKTVEWLTSTTYRNPQTKKLTGMEIAVVDMFGNSIPCYGILKVEYAVSYEVFEFMLDYNEEQKQFEEAHILGVAVAGGAKPAIVGTCKVDPPGMKGLR